MVGASKILTVSYGTFSCTLEGFEDSFGTMKAIAEYFRDLAAHDRYFGAEPPTPDAEMLARIAEREISRRVEARTDDGGITLRAADALAGPAAQDPAGPSDTSRPDRAPGPEPEAEPAAETEDTPDAPGGPATDTVEEPADIPPMTAPAAGSALDADWEDSAEDDADLGDLPEDEIDSETFEDAPGPTGQAGDPAARAAAPAHPDPDSVAAKLQRIRAVVGQTAEAGEYSEDLTEAEAPETPEQVAAVLAEPSAPAAPEPEAVPAAESGDTEADPEDTAEAQAPAPVAEAQGPTPEDDADAGERTGDDDILSSILARSDSTGHDAPAATEIGRDAEATGIMADTAYTDETDDAAGTDDAIETDAAGTEDAAVPAPRARVLRMKRAEFEAAMDAGEIEPVAEGDENAADSSGPDTAPEAIADLAALDGVDEFDELGDDDDDLDSGLSAEEEAALLEELAAVDGAAPEDEAEDDEPLSAIGAEDDADEDATDAISDTGPRASRAELLRSRPDEDEQAMSRLMSEADNQMQEPEGNRRREAIAHLKAAVAATEAARRMGETPGDGTEGETAYRNDLDRVVRPRRTARPAEARTERPRPAPLKLVAAQRVDAQGEAGDSAEAETPAAPRPVTPVRPRRVTAAAEAPAHPANAAPAQTSGGFAEFCARMGAYELSDQLEAAAAYTAFIEGVDDFSRPQIMRKVRDMAPEGFSREDGLRSFGTLLREGRIHKVRNGRFQVAEDTRFHPERRTG